MRFQSYLKESIENDIQKAFDQICKEYNISTVPIKFSNKQLSKGLAYFSSIRNKGSKPIIPKSITIGEWKYVKDYPDEWLYIIGHEIAHHILSQTDSSLRHTNKHEILARKMEVQLKRELKIKPSISKDELKRIKNKLQYWLDPKNKMKLIDIHGQKTYDNEIKKMQDKI